MKLHKKLIIILTIAIPLGFIMLAVRELEAAANHSETLLMRVAMRDFSLADANQINTDSKQETYLVNGLDSTILNWGRDLLKDLGLYETVAITADLQITKTNVGNIAVAGDTCDYNLIVTNNGPDPSSGGTISDTLPDGWTFSSAAGGACSSATGGFTCTVGALAFNASQSFTATVDVPADAVSGTIVTNTATVFGSEDPNPGNDANDTDIAMTTITTSADLAMTKDVDNSLPLMGEPVVFTLHVDNSGPSVATGVVVSDLLPSGYTLDSFSGDGTYVPGTGVWNANSITDGASAELRITATVKTTGTYTNSAQITGFIGADPDSNNDQDSATTTPIPAADLSMNKDVDVATPLVGAQVVFTLLVDNNGPSDATGVVVNDKLPNGYTYVSHSGDGTYVPGTGVWTVGDIKEKNDQAQLQITATVNPSGDYTNDARITNLNEIDPEPNNDQDSATTFPVRVSDLAMTKTVDDATPFVGTPVVFTLRVDNGGPSDAPGVVVRDQLPSGYAYQSDDGGGDYNPATGEWMVGNVPDGAFEELQITATVNPSGDYSNVAEITDLIGMDPDPTNDQDSASTNPIPVADLAMTKTIDDAAPSIGEQIVFTLRVDNDGPSDATGVVVRDQLPTGYTYVSHSGDGTYVPGSGVWTVGNIPADANGFVELQITATVNPSGDYTNVARITALNATDPDLSNNEDSAGIRLFVIHLPFVNKVNDFGEPNDQCEAATDIPVNQDNSFLPEDQDDWYQFNIPSAGQLVVELSNFTPMEGQLTVYRGESCSTRQFLGIDGDIATNKVVDLGTQPAGHYYIYVSNDAEPSLVPYTLRVNFNP